MMQWVVAHPEVDFTDGPQLIADTIMAINAQKKFFNNAAGPNIVSDAYALINSPSNSVGISFYNRKSPGIRAGVTGQFIFVEDRVQWTLENKAPINASNFNDANCFVMREGKHRMICEYEEYIVDYKDDDKDDRSDWDLLYYFNRFIPIEKHR